MTRSLFTTSAANILCVLLLVLCFSAEAQAADNPFSRYYRNQTVRKVTVGPAPVLGSLREGKVYLSQEDAITMALRQNLDVNVERHNYLYDFWSIERGRGVYDPMHTFAFNWDRDTTPSASILEGGLDVTNILTDYRYNYTQNFHTGSSVEVNFAGTRTRSTSLFLVAVPAINTNLEFLFRQKIFEGFGRISADYEIEITTNNLDITKQEFRLRAQEVIQQVLDRYWELQFALQDIEVKQKSLQLATTILDQNRARFEVGTAARLEVVQAEAEAASRREELIRSRFGYRRVQDQLIRLITDYPDPRSFAGEIIPSTPVYNPDPVTDPFDRLQDMADEIHPQIQQAELNVLNQEINVDLSQNRLRPTFDLVAGYQLYGLGGPFVIRDFSEGFLNPPIAATIPGGVGNSFDQLFSGDFSGYVVGVNVQVPLFNTEARAQNAQAQIALDRSALQRESLKQVIAVGIRDALTQIEMNKARLEASEAAVRFGHERLDGEQVRFEVGIGTTRELIEAQRDLLEAETILLRGQIDLIKSHDLLDQAIGRTFERHNVRLTDALETNVH